METLEIIFWTLLVSGIWVGGILTFFQNRRKNMVDPKDLEDFFKYKY